MDNILNILLVLVWWLSTYVTCELVWWMESRWFHRRYRRKHSRGIEEQAAEVPKSDVSRLHDPHAQMESISKEDFQLERESRREHSRGIEGQAAEVPKSDASRLLDPYAQMEFVSRVDFEPLPLLNLPEYEILKILEKITLEIDKGHRVMAQTSMSKIIKPRDDSIVSKRLDFLVIDDDCMPALAVEYQGRGHYGENQCKRETVKKNDAVKRKAIEEAGIEFLEILESYYATSLEDDVRSMLRSDHVRLSPDPAEKDSKEDFKPCRLLNDSGYEILEILEKIVHEFDDRYRVMAQTSVGEIIRPKESSASGEECESARRSINSKCLDFLVIDHSRMPALAVQYQGYCSDRELMFNAVKRKAIEEAGIEFLKIPACYDATSLEDDVRSKLRSNRASLIRLTR